MLQTLLTKLQTQRRETTTSPAVTHGHGASWDQHQS